MFQTLFKKVRVRILSIWSLEQKMNCLCRIGKEMNSCLALSTHTLKPYRSFTYKTVSDNDDGDYQIIRNKLEQFLLWIQIALERFEITTTQIMDKDSKPATAK